jgi:CO/xanthine dehydrogenase FAD-binding subunit
MIVEYQRPSTIAQAVELLKRNSPKSIPMGGGTVVSKNCSDNLAVVDLQALGLDKITLAETKLSIGATATLQNIIEDKNVPGTLKKIVATEAGRNIRNMGTLAGSLVSADGRSVIGAAFLALNAILVWEPGRTETKLEDLYGAKSKSMPGLFIETVIIDPKVLFAQETVRKTPLDLPLIGVFLARDRQGNDRIVLCGNIARPFLLEAPGNKLSLEQAYEKYDPRHMPKEYFLATTKTLIARIHEVLK